MTVDTLSGMRRRFIAVPLLAVLALAGCAGGEAKTAAEPCTSVLDAWDGYMDLATTPGRSDQAVTQERTVVVDAVTQAKADAPTWMKAQLSGAERSLADFVASSATPDSSSSAFSSLSEHMETMRSQCSADGNL